jgi:predicted NAD-dependent protein-ADP-ribosyltransferase YbiA (DUF1768 family)
MRSDDMASSHRAAIVNQMQTVFEQLWPCRLDVDLSTQLGLLVANVALPLNIPIEGTLPADYAARLSVREARLARRIALNLPGLHRARPVLPERQQVHSVMAYWSGKPVGDTWALLRRWALLGRQAIVFVPSRPPAQLGGERLRQWLGHMPPRNQIVALDGAWAPLSNLWDAPLDWDGRTWSSAEHAYQAARAASPQDASWVGQASTPQEARRRGRQIAARPGWEVERQQVLQDLLEAKFKDPCLAGILLSTGNTTLVGYTSRRTASETDGDHDILGMALMRLRAALRTGAVSAPAGAGCHEKSD